MMVSLCPGLVPAAPKAVASALPGWTNARVSDPTTRMLRGAPAAEVLPAGPPVRRVGCSRLEMVMRWIWPKRQVT